MNKQEALKRIENAEKEIALAKAELNKTTDLDMVPDNIQIEKCCGEGDWLGIRFKNHVLYYINNTWAIRARADEVCFSYITTCRLVKIDRDDVLAGKHEGDTVFFTDRDDTKYKSTPEQYGKVVKDEVIYIDFDNMPHKYKITDWENFYKITPLED